MESGRTVILTIANILFSEESGISLELKDGLEEAGRPPLLLSVCQTRF